MTWPLTYNDGINLYSKDCETGISHFACHTLCKLVKKTFFMQLFDHVTLQHC